MKHIWLDCDPGHDDATAILLAIHSPNVKLLGVSTVHGNTDAQNTYLNAQRCLYAFHAPEDVHAYAGASTPLLRPAKHDPEIHGIDGLGGVEGLPTAEHPAIRARIESANATGHYSAIEAIAEAVRRVGIRNEQKVTLISSGPMTNIALFVSVYPGLLEYIEEIVFMGGAVGLGNRSAVAEYNILCDPEAAQIVLNAPVKKTMIPINVTHTAIVTHAIHCALLSPDNPIREPPTLPPADTKLRHTLSTLISYFAKSYKSTFGFTDGPPLHDALTIAYVSAPDMFTCKRQHIDVELNGMHTAGETVVDIWNYRQCDDSWGRDGKNCQVAEVVDVPRFFNLFLECLLQCDKVTPLNK
ncbi:uridine nucleosidase [Rickenella mellea]|uniref:Uridine nucleosidase n=1 Tax=Rickenella mellea TaxID=50990 RepID=A0A4R5XFA1_9AGAM|nr:uridine nucleosidase [Rickenella mellea]